MLQNKTVLSINNKSLQSQQNHAIMELLLLKQQQNSAEWKRSLPKAQKTRRARKYQKQKNQKPHEQHKKSDDNELQEKNKPYQNHLKLETHFDNRIYNRKRQMVDIQQNFSKLLTNKYAAAQLSDNKSKKLYMNRTNYWIGYNKKNSKQDQLKRKQRNYSYLQQTSAFFHRKDQQRKQSKSHFESYKKATANQINANQMHHNQITSNQMQGKYTPPPQFAQQTSQSPRPILMQLNKSLTVRQMLSKIKSHQNIILKQQVPISLITQKYQRNPFDPYIKPISKQHYKKFMPFRMQEEKRIQLSINKLEQRLRNNPEIQIEQIQIKYLDKPNYCSWVQKNRQHARKRSYLPPTLKSVKMAIQ